MKSQNIVQMIFFVFFFSIGAASLAGSLLYDDMVQYYQNKQLLKAEQQYLDQLKSLNTDYDVLLSRLEKDPNLVKRIAIATLGTKSEDSNTIYPRATPEQLTAARKALEDQSLRPSVNEPTMPKWLIRCKEPRRRMMLFLAGAGLILISFICFAPAKKPQSRQQSPDQHE
jgi:hypothetical protein